MSKFEGIFSAKPPKAERPAAKQTEKPKAQDKPEIKTERGKRVGKRSHPDYAQVTAYVRKDTHEEVMRAIYKRREFSELVEELLIDWLKKEK